MTKQDAIKKGGLTEDNLVYRRVPVEDADETAAFGVLCWWLNNPEEDCFEIGIFNRNEMEYKNFKVYKSHRDFVDCATWKV